jgi:hypothetical protein
LPALFSVVEEKAEFLSALASKAGQENLKRSEQIPSGKVRRARSKTHPRYWDEPPHDKVHEPSFLPCSCFLWLRRYTVSSSRGITFFISGSQDDVFVRKFCLLVKNKGRVKKPLLYDHYLRSFLDSKSAFSEKRGRWDQTSLKLYLICLIL